jgi:hypothetical protein
MVTVSASQRRAADWTNVSSTACRSKVERLITLSVGGGGLLLQRFAQIIPALAQLVEQSRVLDGNDSLGGEVSYKFNLLIGETAHLLAIKSDYADEFTFLKQGRVKKSTDTAKVNECDEVVVTLFVRRVFCAVGNVKQLLRHRDACNEATGAYLRLATPKFREGRRRIVRGGNTELGTLVQQ